MRERIRSEGADLYIGRVPLVRGVRFVLWCATALWVPVLLLRGDTTAQARAYDAIRWVADRLYVPGVPPWLSPAETLILVLAGGCAAFSAWDYLLGGSRFSPARVWLAGTFWIGLAAAYLLANPIGYGSWLFVGIALLHLWCLRRSRA